MGSGEKPYYNEMYAETTRDEVMRATRYEVKKEKRGEGDEEDGGK